MTPSSADITYSTLDTVSDEGASPGGLDHRSAIRVWRAIDGLQADQRLHARAGVLLALGVGGCLALVTLQWAAIAWLVLR